MNFTNLTIQNFESVQFIVKSHEKLKNWSDSKLKLLFETCNSICLHQDNEIYSFIFWKDLDDKLEIELLATKKELERSGNMKLLFNKWLELNPEKEVWLEVSSLNIVALDFYLKLGFLKVGLRKNYYSEGEDAILMSYNKLT